MRSVAGRRERSGRAGVNPVVARRVKEAYKSASANEARIKIGLPRSSPQIERIALTVKTETIKTENVVCKGGLPAVIATSEVSERRPLIVLMHERYGLVRHTVDLAQRFARDGHVCIAPDLFFRHPDQDSLHRGDVGYVLGDNEAVELLDAAIDRMRQSGLADMNRVAVMGVCQTGRFPIVYGARHEIAAALVWYGAAAKREWAANDRFPEPLEDLIQRLKCPTLGMFGEADHIISLDDIARFRTAFELRKKSYEIEVFADAPHGWLNDTMPGRYRREQAEAAWALQKSFLDRIFAGQASSRRIHQRYAADISADYDFSKNKRLE